MRTFVFSVFYLLVFARTVSLGQDVQDALVDYLADAELIEEKFDVKCDIFATHKSDPGIEKVTVLQMYRRFTVNRSVRRFEEMRLKLDENMMSFSPKELRIEHFDKEGKLSLAGMEGNFPRNESDSESELCPISMLFLTLDSQSVRNSATSLAALEMFRKLTFVESFDTKSGVEGVWITDQRQFIMEIEFQRIDSKFLPSLITFYVSSQPLEKGIEFGRMYRSRLKPYGFNKIGWEKHGEFYLPKTAELRRGVNFGFQETQLWDFRDWKVGDEVDTTRLDVGNFKLPAAREAAIAEIKKDLSRRK